MELHERIQLQSDVNTILNNAGFERNEYPGESVSHEELTTYYKLILITSCLEMGYDPLPQDIVNLITGFVVTTLKRGDHIECLDPFDRWYLCTVLKVKVPNRVFVHYQGWSLRWDEWLSLEPDGQGNRTAELGKHTDRLPHSCQHSHCKAARIALRDELSELGFPEPISSKALLEVGPEKERAVNWILDILQPSEQTTPQIVCGKREEGMEIEPMAGA